MIRSGTRRRAVAKQNDCASFLDRYTRLYSVESSNPAENFVNEGICDGNILLLGNIGRGPTSSCRDLPEFNGIVNGWGAS